MKLKDAIKKELKEICFGDAANYVNGEWIYEKENTVVDALDKNKIPKERWNDYVMLTKYNELKVQFEVSVCKLLEEDHETLMDKFIGINTK